MRVRPDAGLAEAHAQRIKAQQPPHQRLADAQQQLQHLGGLQHTGQSRQHTQHTGLGTVRRELRRRRLREQAAVARRHATLAASVKHAHLAVETLDGGVHQRLGVLDAGVVEQVTQREVVRPVQHHIHAVQQRIHILGRDPLRHRLDLDRRVQRQQSLARGIDLELADAGFGMHDLPVQVAALHAVMVGEAQVPYPRGGQIEASRRAQATGTQHQHPRLL